MVVPAASGAARSEYVQWNSGKLHTPHLLTFGQLVLCVGSKETAHMLLAQLCRLFVVPKLTELTCSGCMGKFITSPVALSIHQERGCLADPPLFQFSSGDQTELLYSRMHRPVFFVAIDSILMLARSPSFDKPLDVLTLERCGMPLSSVVGYCEIGKEQIAFERGLMKWHNGDSLDGRITFMGMMLKDVARDKAKKATKAKRPRFVYPGPDDTILEVLPFVQPYSKFPAAYTIAKKDKKSKEYHKMEFEDTIKACMDEIEAALGTE